MLVSTSTHVSSRWSVTNVWQQIQSYRPNTIILFEYRIMPEKLVHVKPTKARVALALLVQPKFWPDMWRRVKSNLRQSLLPAPIGQGRDPATKWAQALAIGENAALAKLGLSSAPGFAEMHPSLLAQATQIERDSPETLGGGGGVDLIYRICEGVGANTVVETGVAYGWSSLAILASISPRGGYLWSVDMPHPLLKDQELTGVVVPNALRKRWTLIREPDCTGLSKVLRQCGPIDFIHYDSDKSYHGRAATYQRLWPHLRQGGILLSDDIADNTAFRDFAAEIGSTRS